MSRTICAFVAAMAVGLLAMPVLAQGRGGGGGGCGHGGWGHQGAYGRLFDPSKVETVAGEVLAIQRVRLVRGMSSGIHLQVKTDRETVSVHLGPAWYIDNQEPPIKVKDSVQIVGSRVEVAGNPAIIASELRKGDEVLKLRDAEGFPLWCGWRRWER